MTGIANASALQNSQTLISSLLADIFKGARGGILRPLIDEVSVNGNFLELPVVGMTPRLKKRVGPRQRSELRAFSQIERIETYDKTLSIDRKLHDYDPSGAVRAAVAVMMSEIDSDLDIEFIEMFKANEWKSFDGMPLLDSSHPFSAGSGNNRIASAFSLGAYNTAKNAMRKFSNEDGRKLGYGFGTRILLGGVDDEKAMLEATGARRAINVNSSGAFDAGSGVVGVTEIDNVFAGDALVVITEHIDNGAWGVFDVSRSKPFVFGVAKALQQDDSDARIYDHDEYDRGVSGDLAFGAGPWMCAAGYEGS